MLILLDTNILIRTYEPAHELHRAAIQSVEQLRLAGHNLCFVPQVFYEFWVVATRPFTVNGLGLSTPDAEQILETLTASFFRLYPDDQRIYEEWHRIVKTYDVKGKRAHDARLVAAMSIHGIQQILTFNIVDFTRYATISTIDPLKIATTP